MARGSCFEEEVEMEGCIERGGDDVEMEGDDVETGRDDVEMEGDDVETGKDDVEMEGDNRETCDGFDTGTERGDVADGGSISVWASIVSGELRSRLGNDEDIYSSVPSAISTNIASCAIDGTRSLRATYSFECCFNT